MVLCLLAAAPAAMLFQKASARAVLLASRRLLRRTGHTLELLVRIAAPALAFLLVDGAIVLDCWVAFGMVFEQIF